MVARRRPRVVWPEEGELIPLVREAQGEAPRALDALLARLRPSFVAYFAVALGGDEAEDAAQLALLSIVRALPRIDADGALGYVLAGGGPVRGEAPPLLDRRGVRHFTR